MDTNSLIHENRMRTYDLLQLMKKQNISEKQIVEQLHQSSAIPKQTIYSWHSGAKPWGRKGTIRRIPELCYVLGALLGDGCLYRYKSTNNYAILVGERAFCNRFAANLAVCANRSAKPFNIRSKNVWSIRVNNYELYQLFKSVREDLSVLDELVSDYPSAVNFIQGLFDAEGCVKVIKERVRKIPKICLDVTNTNREFLVFMQHLLMRFMGIEARFSSQKGHIGADGSRRKETHHLRIYKKSYVCLFFQTMTVVKLVEGKRFLLGNWLRNGKALTQQQTHTARLLFPNSRLATIL